jgi:hypothetical protein
VLKRLWWTGKFGDGKLRPEDEKRRAFICWVSGHVAGFSRYLAHGPMFAVGPTLSAGLALA